MERINPFISDISDKDLPELYKFRVYQRKFTDDDGFYDEFIDSFNHLEYAQFYVYKNDAIDFMLVIKID